VLDDSVRADRNTLRLDPELSEEISLSMTSKAAAALEHAALQEKVVHANVEFYKHVAGSYDSYETCVSDPRQQEMLERDLAQISSGLSSASDRISCLDCGGGTGNLALKMLSRDWSVTVVDVSQSMLDILKVKAEALGRPVKLVNDSIESFLSHTNQTFDVISFSSVLHHLYSPVDVVSLAAKRVKHHGFFYSNFDPVKPHRPRLTSMFLTCDTVLAKVFYDRRDFFPGLARRLRKLATPMDTVSGRVVASAGDLAEFHANEGLDFSEIAEPLKKEGFEIDVAYSLGGRTRLAQWVNGAIKVSMRFRIMARREAGTGLSSS
jgi:2-polyprenyl-3-methyl-5-hydroxy-6-metoxy-1,4-benzoquinol methylase